MQIPTPNTLDAGGAARAASVLLQQQVELLSEEQWRRIDDMDLCPSSARADDLAGLMQDPPNSFWSGLAMGVYIARLGTASATSGEF